MNVTSGYDMRNWLLYWLTFGVILAIIHEPWLRLVSFAAILLLVALYRYLRHRTLDSFLLFSAFGISALSILAFIQRGLPFFILAAVVFIGFVIVPIYRAIKRPDPASTPEKPR